MRRWIYWLGALALVAACGDGSVGSVDPNGDADGDGIRNGDEGASSAVNTDGDAFPDWLDLDADGDLIPDAIEAGDSDPSTPPVDTDGDQIPDFQDTDSDGDGIPDAVEVLNDSDNDGIWDFLSLDSDGDCIVDATEAGPRPEAPMNTDGDGLPDYRDRDSDNDGLPDQQEDLNCNGVLDPGESSPTSGDTDNDGTPDLVEVLAGSDPSDPGSNIPPEDFYFVLPYMDALQEAPLTFSTDVKQADVFFSIDTTGSFGQEIDAITTSLQTTIVPGIAAVIPNAAFGVGRFEDFPLDPFGLTGDVPYQLLQPITTDLALVEVGLMALAPAGGGLDIPESGYEGLFQWATGAGLPGFGFPPFTEGGIGGVGFRPDSLPIIVQITDAISHVATDYPLSSGAHSRDQTVAALTSLGIRVVGIDSLENVNTPDDPRTQLEDIAIATSTTIAPDLNNECATGVSGTPRPAVDLGAGNFVCPLVFDVLPDGTGLGSLIVDAIAQLATLGALDISTRKRGQLMGLRGETLPMGTTTADFLIAITPVAPPPAGSTISGDVFLDVTPGSLVTFNVQAKNDFVIETNEPQLFAIDIDVLGDGVAVLDVRRVFVVVPADVVIVN